MKFMLFDLDCSGDSEHRCTQIHTDELQQLRSLMRLLMGRV
ncbi:hypothetical protein [Fischerella thermalis]|nr:hypothetical protein [Fischerella thermalis]